MNQLLDNPISSIELNTHAIGFEAARLLDMKFAGQEEFPVRFEIPPIRVVVRASTDMLHHTDKVVRSIFERVSQHPEQPWTVETLIKGLGVSRRMAEIHFRQHCECGIYDHLINARIQRAKTLLLETDSPIGQIAEASGFCDQRQLAYLFKKRTGHTPSAFRQQRQPELRRLI